MAKTQVLITDIPKSRFSENWPKELKEQLRVQFPSVQPEYFTPLSFLNRIVIILRNEVEAYQLYSWFKQAFEKEPFKVYLAEPLITRHRSRSTVGYGVAEDYNGQLDSADELLEGRSVLKLDKCSSLEDVYKLGSSPSLSPDKQVSPTRLKFPDDQQFRYYMEPAPERSPKAQEAEDCSSDEGYGTQYLYRGRPTSVKDMAPPSPSITLNCFSVDFQPSKG